jgi:hypothetical protein
MRFSRLAYALALALVACGSSPGVPDAGGDAGVVETSTDAPSDAGTSLAWFPGNYVLLNSADDATTERDAVLGDATLMNAFVGIEKRYDWTACEAAQGDYSACIADVESDLAAVDAKGKKLIVFFMYKTFTDPHAVPAYMLAQGPWCTGPVCGEVAMSNGVSAMIWNAGVADRMHAWIAAMGAAIEKGPHASALSAVVFPESACGSCETTAGYTASAYVDAMKGNVTAAIAAFANVIAFQYINFVPPSSSQTQSLTDLADFALATPHAGLGCPDLGPLFNPPEYPLLENAKYQGRVPIAPAVESPDYQSGRTSSLPSTYALGIDPAPKGMAAQIITWANTNNASYVFTVQDVAAYLPSHPNPNIAPPTW